MTSIFKILLLVHGAITVANAQSGIAPNFTITFSRAELDTCGSANQGRGLAFSTRDIPDNFQCFNLDEIFGQEATSGYRNQSFSNTTLSWVVRNGEEYYLSSVYSQMIYQQVNATVEERSIAARTMRVYNDRNCITTNPQNAILRPASIVFSCQSRAEGNCVDTQYGVRSFSIDAISDAVRQTRCLDIALSESAATRTSKGVALWTVLLAALFAVLFGSA